MKIASNTETVELSYLDLLTYLYDDVDSDKGMSMHDKSVAEKKFEELRKILEKYSA